MSNRIYNIMFHTHTISGIIISAALYVIFFTGSISFLRDEIIAWERNEPVSDNYFSEVDFDDLFKSIEKTHPLDKRDVTIYHRLEEQRMSVILGRSKDTLADKSKESGSNSYFSIDLTDKKLRSFNDIYSLGEFFYRLHFFAQLNLYGRSGYLLSGFVAFFFLFAIVTGVIVHWKKIISSFYVFRPNGKWKTIWTDAHVSLGIIGLPFQFMFAVTGAYLIIGYSIMLPPVKSLVFNDDDKAFTTAIDPEQHIEYNYKGVPLNKTVSFNQFILETQKKWPDLKLNRLEIFNYGDKNMHVKVEGNPSFKDKLLGTGHLTFRAIDGKLIDQKNPYGKTSYAEGATNIIQRLHYGDFGGYGMKLIFFVLGLVTCFVIISGVLIWLVARDKKNVPEYKRKFNSWLVHIYMAICLSIYPMTALIFIVVKCFSDGYEGGKKALIYNVFFWGWLALSILFIIKRDNYFTNKASLILGGLLGFLVPISNGLITGNWPWVTWQKGYSQIFVMDIFWILLSITALAVVFKLKPKKTKPPGT